MKKLLVFLVVLVTSCSQSPTQVAQQIKDVSPLTICNVNTNQTVQICKATWNNGQLYPGDVFGTIDKGKCVEFEVEDGQLLMYFISNVRYGFIAHKGEYWNL